MRWILPLLISMLTACGGGMAVAPVGSYDGSSKSAQRSSSPPTVYTVRKGDTLYSISWRYNMDYKQLAQINSIRPPYTIYVGQKLVFKSIKPSSSTKVVSKQPATTTKNTTPTTSTASKTKPVVSSNQNLSWRWPTSGKVISTFSSTSAGRKGIDIAGKAGQNIVAAAAGKVVYSGNGLPRYGNLLIIKHNDTYLSAYAHNQQLLVEEGTYVKSGQKIATLGSTGTQQDKLHFEIRRNGKPVDPLKFLPKK